MGFDYRLLPAIAMQESTLCRSIPVDSHNCWGWGIYGDKVMLIPQFKFPDCRAEAILIKLKKWQAYQL